jgi:hypothetical protein
MSGASEWQSPSPETSPVLPGPGGRTRRGHVYQFAPYHYRLPKDLSEIGAFIQRVLTGDIGLVVFTTPPQVSILIDTAKRLGSGKKLIEVLNSSATIVAVGTVTAATLARHGLKVSVCPPEEDETMMGLVEAVEISCENERIPCQKAEQQACHGSYNWEFLDSVMAT